MWFHFNASRPQAFLGAFVVLLALCPASSASAQSLLQQLFGFGAPKPPAELPLPQSQKPKTNADAAGLGAQHDHAPKNASVGTYRTVCVRTCDGFYIPMSFATTRENFMQDQIKCRATCGGKARLFVHRNPGGAMDDAVDLSGRAYSLMPNAFKFRKVVVQGCACRPPPWSEAEIARHKSYAAAPQLAGAGVAATKDAVAIASAEQTETETGATPAQNTDVSRTSERNRERSAAAAKTRKDARAEGPSIDEPVADRPKRRVAGSPQPKPVRIAAHTPPVPVYVMAPKPSSGLFGLGMGSQSKYKWPGD